eukprot:gnl/Hemi2/8507_TR2948_c0_g1_i1.p1 gnl/Hemi2/8507_TR2948_c0_g1~~gnl/Hemi2/8507_TR2948_c0_g1_i1.p1  ORF type:complete len:275 (+),score=65.03 gnl/Hemi2/8507_TR2948_c0_g1_i1:128-952(+)
MSNLVLPGAAGDAPPAASGTGDNELDELQKLMNGGVAGPTKRKRPKLGNRRGVYHQGVHLACRYGLTVRVAQLSDLDPNGPRPEPKKRGGAAGKGKGASPPKPKPKPKPKSPTRSPARSRPGSSGKKVAEEEELPINPANPNQKHELPIYLQSPLLVKKDVDGWTPLHFAAWTNKPETVRLLLSNGATTNCKTRKNKNTPLHMAAKEGYADVCRVLLEYGANPSVSNKKKKKPLDLSTGETRAVILTALLKISAAKRHLAQKEKATGMAKSKKR